MAATVLTTDGSVKPAMRRSLEGLTFNGSLQKPLHFDEGANALTHTRFERIELILAGLWNCGIIGCTLLHGVIADSGGLTAGWGFSKLRRLRRPPISYQLRNATQSQGESNVRHQRRNG
jgi:hypothetical protein